MGFYKHRIYPWLISKLSNPEPILQIRQRIIPMAQGIVLEIGAGSGLNFTHYLPDKVDKLYALEPNSGMIRFAEQQRLKTRLDVEYIGLPGERIPLPDDSVDTVVSTFVLGTIPGVAEALQGIRRVLRPDGKFLFCEIGLSPKPEVQRWQVRWKPITKWAFQGLDLSKNIPNLIESAGFQIDNLETMYFDETSPASQAWTHCYLGTATHQNKNTPSHGNN